MIDSPFEIASASLVTAGAGGTTLAVRIGTKHDQPLAEATRMEFAYRVASRSASFLRVKLRSTEGPMGTRDYRIMLEAIPIEGGQTFRKPTRPDRPAPAKIVLSMCGNRPIKPPVVVPLA